MEMQAVQRRIILVLKEVHVENAGDGASGNPLMAASVEFNHSHDVLMDRLIHIRKISSRSVDNGVCL
jgi:hypothetical protein